MDEEKKPTSASASADATADKPAGEPSFAPASAEALAGEKTTAGKEKKEAELNIEELKKQRDEYLAGWQRSRADLLNYKKEEMERIDGILQYAQEEFILKILPVLDNFNLALKEIPEELKQNEHAKGLLQIKTQIEDFLKSQGVEEIKATGKKFNPNFHEAVEEVEKVGSAFAPASAKATAGEKATADKDEESGMIIEEVQKGYLINDKLLRPSKVRVTK